MRLLAALLIFVGSLSLQAEDQPAPTGGWQAVPVAQTDPSDNSVDPDDAASDAAMIANAPAVQGPAPDGAVAAMLAIDPKYAGGIVVVTGRGGSPTPRQWIIIARNSQDQGTTHKITVADGQVISDTLSLNTYEALRQKVSISPPQVQVDSGNAFFIAQPIAAANGKIIGRVDYALTVRGRDAAPIWTLNCFDINGGFMGKVILLATTGAVLSQPGFKNSPPVAGN